MESASGGDSGAKDCLVFKDVQKVSAGSRLSVITADIHEGETEVLTDTSVQDKKVSAEREPSMRMASL